MTEQAKGSDGHEGRHRDLDAPDSRAACQIVAMTEKERNSMPKDEQCSKSFFAFLDKFDEGDPVHGFTNPDYPFESVACRPGCVDRCMVCADQWLGPVHRWKSTYDHNYEDKEACAVIKDMESGTRHDLKNVRAKLDTYGDVASKIWHKKTPEQRKNLLRRAMPEMYPCRGFPSIELNKAVRSRCQPMNMEKFIEKFCKNFLLPYLDMATMSEGALDLLALLYQRTQHDPSQWVTFDNDQISYAFRNSFLKTSYNPHCVVMYGEKYGQLVPWDKEAAHRLDIMGFPRALLIFKAQRELSKFLHTAIDLIIDRPVPTSAQGRVSLDQVVTSGQLARWTPLDSYSSASVALHLHKVANKFTACLEASMYELWLIQTDPAYLRRHLSSFNDAALAGAFGAAKVLEHKAKIALIPLTSFDCWQYLLPEVLALEDALCGMKLPLGPGVPLPEGLEIALSFFEHALLQQLNARRNQIHAILICSKAFSHLYAVAPGGSNLEYRSGKQSWTRDPLAHHLIELAYYEECISYSPSYHIKMVQHIIQTSTREATRVDRLLFNVISDMATIDEALTTVKMLRPRTRPFEHFRASPLAADLVKWESIHPLTVPPDEDGYAALGPPLQNFLQRQQQYRAINRHALFVFDDAHAGLQQFWQAVARSVLDSRLGQIRDGYFNHLVQSRIVLVGATATEMYLSEVASDRAALVASIEAKEQRVALAQANTAAKNAVNSGSIQTAWAIDEAKPFQLPKVKQKLKTRPPIVGDPASAQKEAPVDDLNQRVEALNLGIDVVPSTCNVFEQMFDLSSENPRDVKWDTFVDAMIDTGFSVTPGGGSIFTFKQASGGRINFHRPHPDPTIDPVMLRSMGKRLKKWFGFDKDTFVPRVDGKARASLSIARR